MSAYADQLSNDPDIQLPGRSCTFCGYDLRGTTGSLCPECGRNPSESLSRQALSHADQQQVRWLVIGFRLLCLSQALIALMLAASLAAVAIGAMTVPTSAVPLLIVVWIGFGGILIALAAITVGIWMTTAAIPIQTENHAPLWRIVHVAAPCVVGLWWLGLATLSAGVTRDLVSIGCFAFLLLHLAVLLKQRFHLISTMCSARVHSWTRPESWTLVVLASGAFVVAIATRVVSSGYSRFDDGTFLLAAATTVIWLVFLSVPRKLGSRLESLASNDVPRRA